MNDTPDKCPVTDEKARSALEACLPQFFSAVSEFPDLLVEPGLSSDELERIEKKIDFSMHPDLRELFSHCSTIAMNGLKICAHELGPIVMPGSEALIIGEFYLRSAGDRLLMLPADPGVYYLEQRNGAITRLASNLREFFNGVLPNCL